MSVPASAAAPVVIVHGVTDASRPDEQDTLDQVREVAAALARRDVPAETLSLSLDLAPLAELAAGEPVRIFNLVEALAGNGRLIHLAPAVMEHCGLAFTGSGSGALAVTTDKVLTKRLLEAAGIPTPADPGRVIGNADTARFIVKSVHEDASYGIDASSVVAATAVFDALKDRRDRFGGDWFAEEYIEGREFNVSILEDEAGVPQVLPVAEITFEGFAGDRPRIVDYEAKWDAGSFAYTNTPRRFLVAGEDERLASELSRISLETWTVLGLAGYGRVDFRVDAAGRCHVLEANANPCLSRDAGLAAAAQMAGIAYDDLIHRILSRARVAAAPISSRRT